MSAGERGLSGRATEVLVSLHRHRILTTAQIHEVHAPELTLRWTRMILSDLAERGLVDRVWSRRRPARVVWHLTPKGLRAVSGADPARPKVVLAWEAAAGSLQAHTLAVNDVGIAFMRAARALGHECGYLAWRHEVAHRFADRRPGDRDTGILVADAVLDYVVRQSGSELFVSRFIELDRGTAPPQQLQGKLRNYLRFSQYAPRGIGPPQWREFYPTFPPVLVVLAGKARSALKARMCSVIGLCQTDRRLRVPDRPGMFFVLLEVLQAAGPFGSVFVELGDPGRPVDALGRPADSTSVLEAGTAS
jgi:hypothetical protein